MPRWSNLGIFANVTKNRAQNKKNFILFFMFMPRCEMLSMRYIIWRVNTIFTLALSSNSLTAAGTEIPGDTLVTVVVSTVP